MQRWRTEGERASSYSSVRANCMFISNSVFRLMGWETSHGGSVYTVRICIHYIFFRHLPASLGEGEGDVCTNHLLGLRHYVKCRTYYFI